MSKQPSLEAREGIARMAVALKAEVDELAERMATAIHDRVEGLDDDLYEATVRSCRTNIDAILSMLRDDVPALDARAGIDALQYAREFVRRGLPIEKLMQAYRLGHATLSHTWVERLRESTTSVEGLTEAVTYSLDWMFAYVDTVSVGITQAYMDERERWVRSAAALRADEVRAILTGRPVDVDAVSGRLRYELARRHVAFVIWGVEGEATDDTIGDYEGAATEIASLVGAIDVLAVPLGGLKLAVWLGLRDEPDLASLPRRLASAAAVGARIAVGEAGEGVDGFRRSHREAMRARRAAQLSGRSPGACVRYRDAALGALLTAEADEARRFVEDELGPLADESDSTRRLASTLRVFLEEGQSFVGAARRLGVHENTVAYRVRRAGELVGHGVDERNLELRVALLLADMLRE